MNKSELKQLIKEELSMQGPSAKMLARQQYYIDKAASKPSKPKKTDFRKAIEGAKRMIDAGKSEDVVISKYGIAAFNAVNAENDIYENLDKSDPVDTITMDVPLFIRMLEYAREDATEDEDLHKVTDLAISLTKEMGILTMDSYDDIVGGAVEDDEVLTERISMTKPELDREITKIKQELNSDGIESDQKYDIAMSLLDDPALSSAIKRYYKVNSPLEWLADRI